MSGWTHITVEPVDKTTSDTLNKKTVEKIDTAAAALAQSADYEQPAVVDELADLVADAQAQLGQAAAHEAVEAYLQDVVDDIDGAYTQPHPDLPTVRWPSRGENCAGVAKTILDECDAANRVLVVAANDTTDSGQGWLYATDEHGKAKKVDTKEGYAGANGKDVTGYFREEHDIDGRASP